MSKNRFLVAMILAIATIAPAAHAEDPATAAPPKEKKICKTENYTGSRVNVTRICHTEAEWNAISVAASKQVDDLINMGRRTDQGPGVARDPSGGMTSGPPGIGH
jgi:hypothetical protein